MIYFSSFELEEDKELEIHFLNYDNIIQHPESTVEYVVRPFNFTLNLKIKDDLVNNYTAGIKIDLNFEVEDFDINLSYRNVFWIWDLLGIVKN